MQCSHELSIPDVWSSDFAVYGVTQPGTSYQIEINMEGRSPTMLGRYLGCIMIGFMPDEGLEEALLSLKEMLEFYTTVEAAPSPKELEREAVNATIADEKKRPDLVVV